MVTTIGIMKDKQLTDLLDRGVIHLANLDAGGLTSASGELSLLIEGLVRRLERAREDLATTRVRRANLKKAYRDLQAAYTGLLRWRDQELSRRGPNFSRTVVHLAARPEPEYLRTVNAHLIPKKLVYRPTAAALAIGVLVVGVIVYLAVGA